MVSTRIATQIYAKICFETTPGQKKIVEKLSEYLSDSDFSRIFVLNGYAGTGKTTLIAALVGALKELEIKPVLLAPTGRAAKVLAQYAHEKAFTIHKRIYRERTAADYERRFSLNLNTERGAVFIVDEASMLSDRQSDGASFGSGSLLEDLVQFVRSGRGCRLILVGDSAQLPPVGSDFSPALDPVSMEAYGEVVYATMDEVVRQEAQSGILFNATLVRCMLERGIHDIPRFRTDFPDIEALSGGDFLERLQDCYDRYGRDETIVITRSNKRANRYNEGIRRHVLGAEEEIESGDMLMVVKNNYHYTERIENCPVGFLANGDIARLKRLRRFEEFYGFRFADAVLEFPDYEGTEIACKILLDTIASESPSLTRDESMRLFYEVEKDYLDIGSKIKRFREIRENPHFNAVQVKFSYAVTCHKAQGGQWRAVFVDRCLFGDETMTRDMLRWLYTALTRATDKLFLVNFDETFYE
ncbi:ATP-dependent RecD-like DNA helicase [Alistipes sp.]|uniref:ATP-dependent DNA helicase n=1 Tax=Alistipes sp. TaxID=1872444 RepID=UPI000E991BC3|nr:AAA family ATPase [Alistipes sp.]HBX90962.1 ATP-dependent endonuclease [Alistipes sp.]HCN13445.1 ATP-dependent endonuclease [Alistipes sp.]